MRFFLLCVIRTTDFLILAAVLALIAAGIYSIWLDVLNKPSIVFDIASLILCSLLAWLTGNGVNRLIQRKLHFSPPYQHWQVETRLYHSEYGDSKATPCLTWMVYVLSIVCFLPIFYSLLPAIIFWILIVILVSISVFCLSQFRYGLIQKNIQATYFPLTQPFIDFYSALADYEWTDDAEQLFRKIDPSSTDAIVAEQIRASLLQDETQPIKKIYYNYIDIGYGPGFDATPENIAAAEQSNLDFFNRRLKTHEHLG